MLLESACNYTHCSAVGFCGMRSQYMGTYISVNLSAYPCLLPKQVSEHDGCLMRQGVTVLPHDAEPCLMPASGSLTGPQQ